MSEEDFSEEQLKKFIETLPPAVLTAMAGVLNVLVKEVIGTIHKEHDVLFCGSNGQNVVKCLHYDRSVLDGEDTRHFSFGEPLGPLSCVFERVY